MNKILIFKKVTSRVIECHQMSGKGKDEKKKNERKIQVLAKKEKSIPKVQNRQIDADDIRKQLCRTEGTEAPVFSWDTEYSVNRLFQDT